MLIAFVFVLWKPFTFVGFYILCRRAEAVTFIARRSREEVGVLRQRQPTWILVTFLLPCCVTRARCHVTWWRGWPLASGLGARPEVFSLGPLTDLVGFRAGFVLVALATTVGSVSEGGWDVDWEPGCLRDQASFDVLAEPLWSTLSVSFSSICISHHVFLFVLPSKRLRAKFIAWLQLLGWPRF